jgi:sugar lactone lactonase YvrE
MSMREVGSVRRRLGAAVRIAAVGLLGASASVHAQGGAYVNFETIPTRAVALSPDGKRLFVANTPDGRLEILDVSARGLQPVESVTVGLDPVAVAARSSGDVWVVNLLSDSVSVVDVSKRPAHVVRTLLVGDEPRDIVFAGPGNGRAFITAARRGQNHPDDVVNETQVPSTPRADVWVFDAKDPGSALGGKPLTIVKLFADKPGALAASPDGRTVFVSIATSGNESTTINAAAICGTGGQAGEDGSRTATAGSRQSDGPCRLANGGMAPGGTPGPNVNLVDGAANPRTGIIAKFDRQSGAWLDQAGRDWRDAVPFTLPDNDVFTIDAMANPPKPSGVFQHAGTLNASLAVHPSNGKVYLATIEAQNTNRFLSVPGMGAFPNPNPARGVAKTADPLTGKTLNGHLYESRIAILSPGGGVVSRHLNKHIDYEVVPSPAGVKERSVADPKGVVFSPDGRTLFVAALGSNAIVPFQTSELDNDSFQPNASTHIPLSGDGGPTDMAIEASGARMFVYKRFDNAVAVVDLQAKKETQVVPLFSPEPKEVREGRKFFYDARLGSSNGEANCNVCHPAADKDDLAWDLGTPFFGVKPNPNPSMMGGGRNATFNPLKGPMTVLTLRGIKDSGPMFWRGDMTNDTNPMDERRDFQGFNIVFPALLGRDGLLPQADFDQLTNWVLSIVPPPNPHRPLNNMLNASQQEGMAVFTGARGPNDGGANCNTCHNINPAMGFFGTRGQNTFEGETQQFKVTQLRTLYDKVGMFGRTNGGNGDRRTLGGPRARGIGPQIRGTGAQHDGTEAGPEDFLTKVQFQLNEQTLKQVVDFLFAFPTNLAPIVGQQVTLRSDSGADTGARIDLLKQRAGAPFTLPGNQQMTECDLTAKAVVDGRARGFLFEPRSGDFLDDTGQRVSDAELRGFARTAGQEVTFTCIYPGGGRRFGIDRNLDGTLDGMGSGRSGMP